MSWEKLSSLIIKFRCLKLYKCSLLFVVHSFINVISSSEVCFYVQSFWMDNQTGTAQNMESLPLDSNYAPVYDRGYALGLTMASSSTNQEG